MAPVKSENMLVRQLEFGESKELSLTSHSHTSIYSTPNFVEVKNIETSTSGISNGSRRCPRFSVPSAIRDEKSDHGQVSTSKPGPTPAFGNIHATIVIVIGLVLFWGLIGLLLYIGWWRRNNSCSVANNNRRRASSGVIATALHPPSQAAVAETVEEHELGSIISPPLPPYPRDSLPTYSSIISRTRRVSISTNTNEITEENTDDDAGESATINVQSTATIPSDLPVFLPAATPTLLDVHELSPPSTPRLQTIPLPPINDMSDGEEFHVPVFGGSTYDESSLSPEGLGLIFDTPHHVCFESCLSSPDPEIALSPSSETRCPEDQN